MDKFSKEKRSEIMSKIRSKDTTIEKIVFGELRKRKIYFQKHYSKVIGKPDIALPRKKKLVFIDGDFWHGYQFAKLKQRLPKYYWLPKIRKNIKRDRSNRKILKEQGWKILRIWEHDVLNSLDKTINKIIKFITGDNKVLNNQQYPTKKARKTNSVLTL